MMKSAIVAVSFALWLGCGGQPPNSNQNENETVNSTNNSDKQLFVNYSRTLAEMIKAGQYEFVQPEITEENFPIQQSGIFNNIKVVLAHFKGRPPTEKEISQYHYENDTRNAKIEELLAFGEKYPDVQKLYPIVALESSFVSNSGGYRVVPLLWMNDGFIKSIPVGRFLGLGPIASNMYTEDTRFLFVYK